MINLVAIQKAYHKVADTNSRIYIKMKMLILKNDILIVVLICIISRLPQILSPYLFLDPDESIMGLMAKHFSEGKVIPYFFYGQNYGFALIEVFIISLFYKTVGISDLSIKISMLLLWIVGVIFFYKTLKQIEPKKHGWTLMLTIFLFVLSPAWAIRSLKAHGGYITSFGLSSVVTYMTLLQ